MAFRGSGSVVVRKPQNRQIGNLIGRIQPLELGYPVIHSVLVGNHEIERRIMRVHDPGRGGNIGGYADRIIRNDATGVRRFAFLA